MPPVSYDFSPAAVSTFGTLEHDATGIDLYSADGGHAVFTRSCVWYLSAPACHFGPLAAGTWELRAHYTEQAFDDDFRIGKAAYFVVPDAPTMTARANDDRTLRFSGGGVAGDRVVVTGSAGDRACSATVDYAGQWSCAGDEPSPR